MSRGVVLVRSGDPGLQLQALRTALSLSLGDRPADLLVSGAGVTALNPAPDSEAEHCLQTLRQMKLGVEVDRDVASGLLGPDAGVLSHDDFVERLGSAAFVQVF